MAKRKRLTPARMLDADAPPPPVAPGLGARPPIADVAHDAAASAALREVAEELSAARAEGRLIQRLPLTEIVTDHLVRDRMVVHDDDQTALQDSIADRGQQTPIEVTALPDGRYGLISGYRRVRAIRNITGVDTVLAVVRQPAEASDAYQAMVDENEMRVGLSFYERARIIVRAVEAGVFGSDKEALLMLFAHVPRARRSKIKSFLIIVRALDGDLSYPTSLTEKLGLTLAQALEQDAGVADRVRAAVAKAQPSLPEEEHAVLAKALKAAAPARPADKRPAPQRLRINDRLDMVRHASGRIELIGPATYDRAFVDALMGVLKDYK